MKETRFKDTEIGRIPEEWGYFPITEIVENNKHSIKIGPFGSQLKKEFLINNGPYKVYGQENVYYKDFTYCYRFLSDQRFKALITCEIVPGDFLISTMGTVGKCAVVPTGITPGIMDSHLLRIRFKPTINKLWFSYLFSSETIQKQISILSVGGIMDGLSSKIIKGLKICIPNNLSEQNRIASALTSIDNLISSLDKLIEKKKAIKEGTMQQLLTGKKRLKGFNEPWVEKELGSVCSIFGRIGFRGYTKADLVEKHQGAITYSPSDIHNQILDNSNCDYISYEKYEESPEIKVYNGDILFCKTASIGKCAIVMNLLEKATINPQFVVLKDFKCNNVFLYYILAFSDFQDRIKLITGGSTIPTMSQEKMKRLKIFLPNNEEQNQISNLLTSMDQELQSLEAKRNKYIKTKQGMMQQLLTGRIRLA